MRRITFRYGLLAGMGQHCPIRRLKRLALIALLAAAAIAAALDARDTAAQLAEVHTDRESLIALLNGTAALVEQKPNGTSIYTHIEATQIKVPPVIVGLK